MEKGPTQARLYLGDRPRIEIVLASGTAGPPSWLAVDLPAPDSEPRLEGRIVADPRIPESEMVLTWSQVPAVPRALIALTVTVGDQSWTLEQDLRNLGRWRFHAEADTHRAWS